MDTKKTKAGEMSVKAAYHEKRARSLFRLDGVKIRASSNERRSMRRAVAREARLSMIEVDHLVAELTGFKSLVDMLEPHTNYLPTLRADIDARHALIAVAYNAAAKAMNIDKRAYAPVDEEELEAAEKLEAGLRCRGCGKHVAVSKRRQGVMRCGSCGFQHAGPDSARRINHRRLGLLCARRLLALSKIRKEAMLERARKRRQQQLERKLEERKQSTEKAGS